MDSNRTSYQKAYRKRYGSKRVNLTLSPEEYRTFLAAANKDKQKLTSYIKSLAVSALENQAHIPQSLQAELQTLRFAILNIANNVNQIAHHSNRVRGLTAHDEHNLLLHIKQLDDVVQAYTAGQILHRSSHDT